MNQLELIKDWDSFQIYEYKPSLNHLFYNNMEPLTVQRRVRFIIELIRGYKVYYLYKDKQVVAYSVVSPGGGRYSFAGKKDIVVGPYYVSPECRGNHYSEILVRQILNLDNIDYEYAYDWVRKNNTASMITSERIGFTVIGTANLKGITRRIVPCTGNEGSINILKYSK